jgi:hypothetical protein
MTCVALAYGCVSFLECCDVTTNRFDGGEQAIFCLPVSPGSMQKSCCLASGAYCKFNSECCPLAHDGAFGFCSSANFCY